MRPAPVPDRDGRPWWDALARHELVAPGCRACARLRWPPRAICGECGALEWEWQALSGRAAVVSWVVNHHAFGDAFPLPYVVVMGRLDEQDDIVIPAGFEGDRDALAVGAPLVAAYADAEGFTALVWHLAQG